MRFLPGSHKLTFTVWEIALAQFTPVILTLCHLCRVPSFSPFCYVSTEMCDPIPMRNFANCYQGLTGIKIYGPL